MEVPFSYRPLPPSPELSLLVDFFYEVKFGESFTSPTATHKILPFIGCEIWVVMTGELQYLVEGQICKAPQAFLLGQAAQLREYLITPPLHLFCIRLKQPYLKFLLQDYRRWRDYLFPLKDILPNVNKLVVQLLAAPQLEIRQALFEAYLQKQFSGASATEFPFWFAQVAAQRHQVGVEAMAAAAGMSKRHLERNFRKWIDLTPKEFLRIQRLDWALSEYANNQALNGTEVTYLAEYADQAHFIKEFRKFCQESPVSFFKDRPFIRKALT